MRAHVLLDPPTIIAAPADLPAWLANLGASDDQLRDWGWAGHAGEGSWPIIETREPVDLATEIQTGPVETIDPVTRTVTLAYGIRALTPEEIAASLPPIDARQLRLTLLAHGLLATVEPAIEALPEPARSAAKIEWEYASRYHRDRELIAQIAAALGLSAAQVNAMWIEALAA